MNNAFEFGLAERAFSFNFRPFLKAYKTEFVITFVCMG
jgi:hypothetical protein